MEQYLLEASLVIPVKNEEKTILSLLESIKNLSRHPSEVIITDGGSTDKTVFLIKEYIKNTSTSYAIKVIETGHAFPGKGRNIAIREAKNDIIACTDAGVKLDSNWLSLLLQPLEGKEADLVIGDYKVLAHNFFEECAFYIANKGLRKKDIAFSGCTSLAFKRDVWEKVGGFGEDLYPCEDKIFLQKIKEANFNVKKTPGAIAYWRPRSNLFQLTKQCFRYGLADGKISFAARHHLMRISFYIASMCLLILGFKFKIFLISFIILLLSYLLHSAILCYTIIRNPLVFIYAPGIVLAKDLSQVVGYTIGSILRQKRPL